MLKQVYIALMIVGALVVLGAIIALLGSVEFLTVLIIAIVGIVLIGAGKWMLDREIEKEEELATSSVDTFKDGKPYQDKLGQL